MRKIERERLIGGRESEQRQTHVRKKRQILGCYKTDHIAEGKKKKHRHSVQKYLCRVFSRDADPE